MRTLPYLSAIIIITIVIGLVYVGVQQTYRSNANDPQMQILYYLRDALEKGNHPAPLLTDSIDLQKSLSVFIAAYDPVYKPVWCNGYLQKSKPQLPKELFRQARINGEHWVTWQPQRCVRIALGIVHVQTGSVSYIVAGRSLKLVEQRVSKLMTMTFMCWLLCFSIILVNWFVHFVRIHHTHQKQTT